MSKSLEFRVCQVNVGGFVTVVEWAIWVGRWSELKTGWSVPSPKQGLGISHDLSQ